MRVRVDYGFVFVGAVVVSLGFCCNNSGLAADWPAWRGPEGNGVSQETRLPLEWSDTEGVLWKRELPAWGASTPAIWGDALFVTSHVDDKRLLLMRLDKQNGKIVWTRLVGTDAAPRQALGLKKGEQRRHQKFHNTQNLASPSPTTDGERVVVHFGNGDLAAYDFQGHRLWSHNMQKEHGDFTIWWGHANSPVLFKNLVIVICMQDSCIDLPGKPSPSYLVAYDKQTGKQVWTTRRMTEARAEHCDSYITPIFRSVEGQTEMIVMGGEMLDAYNPATGKQRWYLPNLLGNRVITGTVLADDLLITTCGMRGPVVAVRPSGSGKRPESDIVWQYEKGTPDTPCPVVWKGLLFLVSDRGIATCLDLHTGKPYWTKRLPGRYHASPLAAEGRIYFLNMKGLTTVVAASSEYKRLAENQIDDDTLASPVVSDGKIYLRGRHSLYCLEKK